MTIAGSCELYLGANQAPARMVAPSSLHHLMANNEPWSTCIRYVFFPFYFTHRVTEGEVA